MPKTIVITGAGVGLGRALARRFGEDGDNVVLLGRTESKLQTVASEIGGHAMAVQCDVSSPDSVREAFAAVARRHATLDVLVNNAAVYEPFTVAEASDEQIARITATNLLGPIYCCRAAIPMMGPGGHILNVSSESVDLPFAHLSLYQTTKAGLERFSKALEQELSPDGIRVTTVRAGQMFEEGKGWDVNPEAAMRFAAACAQAGLDLRARPISHVNSVVGMFRALVDLPEDLHSHMVTLSARRSQIPRPPGVATS